MSKRKLLIHEVFKKAELETGKKTKNGLAVYLWTYFDERFPKSISDKTLSRYYDAFIAETKDEIKIDVFTLDKLSGYLGYRDFADFSRTFVKKNEEANKTTVKIHVDEEEESLSEKISKIIINITNEQHFKMPELLKQNGLGIAEFILVIFLLTGNVVFSNNQKSGVPLGFLGPVQVAKDCMYWDKNQYKQANCGDRKPGVKLMPIDTFTLKNFKRITRKDTLTIENALGRTWYSKYNGNVEFFTMDGQDPDNGRELRAVTSYIIGKYAGNQYKEE